ncbi:hypothetical protein EOA36_00695 [Mesorhizobium sp. M8A.F.Ca.ET.021.01.1.1]|nr:hypothetical protein EOA36_00695 [Mesorhizobium sp. M8A.F.Ca.ET.021.01.1.1]
MRCWSVCGSSTARPSTRPSRRCSPPTPTSKVSKRPKQPRSKRPPPRSPSMRPPRQPQPRTLRAPAVSARGSRTLWPDPHRPGFGRDTLPPDWGYP